ncbi:hypothetical protein TNCV_4194061 [Trichonephila clavipes]|nr:hypothetical protein TNCV_4194061 [Trichonephila clavipes]
MSDNYKLVVAWWSWSPTRGRRCRVTDSKPSTPEDPLYRKAEAWWPTREPFEATGSRVDRRTCQRNVDVNLVVYTT